MAKRAISLQELQWESYLKWYFQLLLNNTSAPMIDIGYVRLGRGSDAETALKTLRKYMPYLMPDRFGR